MALHTMATDVPTAALARKKVDRWKLRKKWGDRSSRSPATLSPVRGQIGQSTGQQTRAAKLKAAREVSAPLNRRRSVSGQFFGRRGQKIEWLARFRVW